MCTYRMSTKLSKKRSRKERKSSGRWKTSSRETVPASSRPPSHTSRALPLTWKTCPRKRWPNGLRKPCRPPKDSFWLLALSRWLGRSTDLADGYEPGSGDSQCALLAIADAKYERNSTNALRWQSLSQFFSPQSGRQDH